MKDTFKESSNKGKQEIVKDNLGIISEIVSYTGSMHE